MLHLARCNIRFGLSAISCCKILYHFIFISLKHLLGTKQTSEEHRQMNPISNVIVLLIIIIMKRRKKNKQNKTKLNWKTELCYVTCYVNFFQIVTLPLGCEANYVGKRAKWGVGIACLAKDHIDLPNPNSRTSISSLIDVLTIIHHSFTCNLSQN